MLQSLQLQHRMKNLAVPKSTWVKTQPYLHAHFSQKNLATSRNKLEHLVETLQPNVTHVLVKNNLATLVDIISSQNTLIEILQLNFQSKHSICQNTWHIQVKFPHSRNPFQSKSTHKLELVQYSKYFIFTLNLSTLAEYSSHSSQKKTRKSNYNFFCDIGEICTFAILEGKNGFVILSETGSL